MPASYLSVVFMRFTTTLPYPPSHPPIPYLPSPQRPPTHPHTHRYCGDLLTALVTQSLGKAPMEAMAALQEDIDACDRAGGRDAELPGDEDRESFVSLVAAGCSRQDVEEVVVPLLGQ